MFRCEINRTKEFKTQGTECQGPWCSVVKFLSNNESLKIVIVQLLGEFTVTSLFGHLCFRVNIILVKEFSKAH